MPVDGVKSLTRKLSNLSASVDGKMLERALVSGGLLIQNEAKEKAPYKTGTLRRSIHIGGHEDLAPGSDADKDRSGIPVPDPEVGKHDAAIYVGTNVIYGAAQEFGRPDVNLPAHPYMRPAFDTAGDAAKQEVADALAELIRKAAK